VEEAGRHYPNEEEGVGEVHINRQHRRAGEEKDEALAGDDCRALGAVPLSSILINGLGALPSFLTIVISGVLTLQMLTYIYIGTEGVLPS
jgi:hypothetical protein